MKKVIFNRMDFIRKNLFIIVLLITVLSVPTLSFAQLRPISDNQDYYNNMQNATDLSPNNVDIPGTQGDVDVVDIPGTQADDPSPTIVNPIKVDNIQGLIKNILIGVIKIGLPIVALAIIYCGFLFVAARGNSEKIKKAKDALIYTLIGAAILLGAWAIAQLISDTVLELGK